MNILVLNPGSSSLKSGYFRFPEELAMPGTAKTVAEALATATSPIDAVGVRVVHGGSRFETYEYEIP